MFLEFDARCENRILARTLAHRVMQSDHTVREPRGGEQLERHGAGTRGDQGNALAYERRDQMNHEFVDSSHIEERRYDLGAAHHPYVFSFLLAQTDDERFDWFGHKFHAGWHC